MRIIILGLYYIFSFFFVIGYFSKDDRSFAEELLFIITISMLCWAMVPFILGEEYRKINK